MSTIAMVDISRFIAKLCVCALAPFLVSKGLDFTILDIELLFEVPLHRE